MTHFAFRPTMIAVVLPVFLLLLALAPRTASGAPSDADRATARELGNAALTSLEAKDYAAAIDGFTRAIALYDAPTLRLGRARALRAVGRFVSAAEDYRTVLLRAPAPNDPAPIQQANRDAKAELPDVEASIAHLTVVLTGGPAVLHVDGVEWPAAAIGVPRPLDPGEHLVEAFSTPKVQSQRITLAKGQSARVDLELPPGATGSAAVPPPGMPPPLVSLAPTDAAASSSSRAVTSDHTAAFVVLGISGAAAAGAVITGLLALSKKTDFDRQNHTNASDGTKQDLRDQASTMALVSTVLTGAAVVGGGISVYLFVAPGGRESSPHAGRSVNAAIGLSGQF